MQETSTEKITLSTALSDGAPAESWLLPLFQALAEVQRASAIDEILRLAALRLGACGQVTSCAVYVEDRRKGGVLYAQSVPEPDLSPFEADKHYRELLGLFGEGDKKSVEVKADEQADHSVLLLPLRAREGQWVGLVELICPAQVPLPHDAVRAMQTCVGGVAEAIEQLRLRLSLEKDEAMYRTLIDNVSDVIFRVDREGKFTFVSRQVWNQLGIHWRDMLGLGATNYVKDEKDAERLRQAFASILKGQVVSLDLTMRRADGGEVVVSVSANPIMEGEQVTGALGIAHDVTEKRRLEEQIAESERRYRALTENAYDAILLIDPETYSIVDANPQAEKLTGYSRGELLSKSVLDLRRPERIYEVQERIREVMNAGVGRFEDAALICKDGHEVLVDTAASVYELEGRRYYQAIIRDITEQKHMNEVLEERVMELQVLSEVSDALQSAVDLQSVMGIALTGVTAGKGLGFNRAFILSYDKLNNELRGEAGLGPRTAEEAGRIWGELAAKGLSLSEILEEMIRSFPEDADTSFEFARHFVVTLDNEQNVFARAIRNREAIRVDTGVEDAHLPGEFVALYSPPEFAIVPLVTRDDVMGVLLVDNLFTRRRIRDDDLHRLKLFANSAASAIERSRLLISLERRLHELTLANQDLKVSRDRLIKTERLSAIGEVAASVAHEIRNPLTAIGGFARTVYSSLGDNDKNRRKLEIILEETDRLEHMLSSLLEFTRPAVPRFTELDLNALVMQTVHFMGQEINPNSVHVAYKLDPQIPRVWADGQQIRQVLLNVVRNALQEMPRGGTMTFESSESDGEVQVAVHDTGPGITPDILDKIFEAFFTTKPSGSGLGLAICSQIMRNHNGRLEAYSRAGEGATFVLTLPVAQKGLDSY
ncbi:MAG TPA: PAS domain S-box protein [bacterium]